MEIHYFSDSIAILDMNTLDNKTILLDYYYSIFYKRAPILVSRD